MRFILAAIFTILLLFSACKRGENYCPEPKGLQGFKTHQKIINPTDSIVLELQYEWEYDLAIYEQGILFNFTVPNQFENAKGDLGIDVVDRTYYMYKLKNPNNAPDSVVIKAYGFTDCGRSEIVSTVFYYK